MNPQIMDVRPNWHEEFDNPASFEVFLDCVAQNSDMVWQHRNGIYAANCGVDVSFYAYRAPGQGYGGRVYEIKMQDGTTKKLIGPWSGSAYAASATFPEWICTDVSITSEPKVWNKGYTFYSGAVLVSALVDWYLPRSHKLSWGLAFMDTGTIQPTKGRFVKGGTGNVKARLLPRDRRIEQKYFASNRAYFMESVNKFYLAIGHQYDEMSGEQRIAINA